MTGYVYMLASQKHGTIYIGVTSDLGRRMPEHRGGQGSRFTARYGVRRLVWYEEHFDVRDAIQREKSLKRWPRQWKIDLIEKTNPESGGVVSRLGLVANRKAPALSSAGFQNQRAVTYHWHCANILHFVILGQVERSGTRPGDPCRNG